MKKEILKTEEAISITKTTFESLMKRHLDLTKVSAPIAVMSGTGINDDLNGVERTVKFPVKALRDRKAVVVNSLAKWKRVRLQELEVEQNKGIITDMRAIRPDEDYSKIHSVYVDQWDWEKHISKSSRSVAFLKKEVCKIYKALQETEQEISKIFPEIIPILPPKIQFIHSEELLLKYPTMTSKEREKMATKEYGAVFLMGIGSVLSHGEVHDGRAPDYDDWSSKNDEGYLGLNGDILVWHPILEDSFELSSMGIRVDAPTLNKQLKIAGQESRKDLYFHQLILNDHIPQSIGGGIGQSRVCMFMLRKKHIGEVQVGIWEEDVKKEQKEKGVFLL